MKAEKIIRLRMQNSTFCRRIPVVQGDTARTFRFILEDITLDGTEHARIYARKPSGTEIYDECDVIGSNEVIFTPETEQIFIETGIIQAEIRVAKGEKLITSYSFEFEVRQSAMRTGDIPSSDEFNALERAIEEAKGLHEPEFTEAGKRENIVSGETMQILFGKIKKWFTDLGALIIKIGNKDISSIGDGTVTGAITDLDKRNTKNTSDIDIERKRIDNIAKLPDGATTGDAELKDIRVGADGKIYDTAGEAVRQQINEIDKKYETETSSLKEDLEDYAKKGLYTIYSLKRTTQERTRQELQLKANTMYLADIEYGGVDYTVNFRGSNDDIIYTLVDSANESQKALFYVPKDTTYINVWNNSESGSSINVKIYEIDTFYSNSETVVLSDYLKQYSEITDYIVNIKKGELVTIELNVSTSLGIPSHTVVFFDDDIYSPLSSKNLKIWDAKPSYSYVETFVADRDYRFLHIWKNKGILTLKVTKKRRGLSSELDIAFFNGSYNEDNTAKEDITNRVRTQLFGGKGLFIVSFPDTMHALYWTRDKDDVLHHVETSRPFSIYSNGTFGVSFLNESVDNPLTVDSDLSGIKMRYVNESQRNKYDVVVSASDSKDFYKSNSDIICDGTNDTDILAGLFGCNDSINVLLHGGNYNITKMWEHSVDSKVALGFNEFLFGENGGGYRRYITVHGDKKCTPQTQGSVNLIVSKELHDSLENGMNYFVVGAPYSNNEEIQRIAVSTDLKNINIIGYGYDKPITYVDTTRCLSSMLESVNVRSWNKNITSYNPFENTPNKECCGIRVGRGSDYGIQNYVKHSNVWYCGKGVACNGEHFIFEDVKTHHDYIGFVFGDRKTVGRMEHPNIMIGCSIEGCYRLMMLTKNGITEQSDFVADYDNKLQNDTLIIIGLSTETSWMIPINERTEGGKTIQETKPILEILKGCYRGRIEIDGYWSPTPFEKDGSGKNMLSIWYDGCNSIIRRGSENIKFYIN